MDRVPDPPGASATPPARLPGGLTRRQFLEDLLDVMGDAQVIVLGDGTEVHRDALVDALADELGPA